MPMETKFEEPRKFFAVVRRGAKLCEEVPIETERDKSERDKSECEEVP